jgi:hypothetical protein
MTPRNWLACSLIFADALCAAPRARACAGGDDYGAAERTTFDPAVLDDPSEAALFYDPETASVGSGPCVPCAADEMRDDWRAFLGPTVTPDDWARVLLSATLPEIDGLIRALQGKANPPAGFEESSLLKLGAGPERDRRIAVLYFVGFARRVEPYAAPPPGWGEPRPTPVGDPDALQANGEKAFQRTRIPFLRQRYAFQLLRLRFYRNDWTGVAAFHDQQRAALERPSTSLKWRARHYLAGALAHDGQRAKANLLLARIHAGSPALAPAAALDFRPMEQADWNATLALATSTAERVELWRLVGLKLDALEATRRIFALDPGSKRMALLVVREINRAEVQANEQALVDLEALSRRLADAPTTDRRWIFDLVAGHAAALRGDVTAARPRLERAMKESRGRARPGTLVETQAWASLALALSKKRPDPRTGDELARALGHVPAEFSRRATLEHDVRARLGTAYQAAGLCVEARLFGTEECAAPWSDPRFVEAMIGRVSSASTPFDRFMVEGSGYTPEGLRQELALLHVARGDLEKASRLIRGPKGTGGAEPLRIDPFAIRIHDCMSCDRAAYAQSRWTPASFIARVIELRAQAQRAGEEGAAAALALGNAYYNISPLGNARALFDATHVSVGPNQAEAWYRQAYDRFKVRELKVKAAYLAAKAELGRRLSLAPGAVPGPVDPVDNLPIATDWFPIVKRYTDTAYHREILRACGTYRRWVAGK